MKLFAFSIILLVAAIASPIVERAAASDSAPAPASTVATQNGTAMAAKLAPPTVTIKNGTVIGSRDGFLTVDSFSGIPYADPPIGPNRLRLPSPLATGFGTLTATATPTACPQLKAAVNANASVLGRLAKDFPLLFQAPTSGEDCLTLNVQRPHGIDSTSAPIPVVVWIYGGGFSTGSTQKYHDGTTMIKQSVKAGASIIFVAMNYRLKGFGFLPGQEVKSAGISNLGLRDQRLAFQWVQDNIAAFGGDPTKVTIWVRVQALS